MRGKEWGKGRGGECQERCIKMCVCVCVCVYVLKRGRGGGG